MNKYQEPEVIDPKQLEIGDQVAFGDAGARLQPLVGDTDEDVHWLTLLNKPAECDTVPEHDYWRPVPAGNAVLHVERPGWSDGVWVHGVLPQVLARRAIQ